MNLLSKKSVSVALVVLLANCTTQEAIDENDAHRAKNATAYNVELPAMDQKSFEDYERFKAWRRSQQSTSTEYQEYQDWQAYQQYRRFKAQQQTPAQ